jgi:predicted transcriptional regulator
MLQSGGRRPPLPRLRRAIALKLINEYGLSVAETARRVGISTSGVAQKFVQFVNNPRPCFQLKDLT